MGNAVVDFGNGFVADFSDLLGTEGDTETLAEEVTEGNADNATLEGEEVSPAPEKEKAPEPEKKAEPEKPAEPEKEPEPGGDDSKPKEPPVKEYKIKVGGVEYVERPTEDDIKAALQIKRDQYAKYEDLAEKRKKYEAIEKLVMTPWFKEVHAEAIRTGAIETPTESAPASDPVDVYEYEKRKSDPDFEDNFAKLKEYALGLPETAQGILASVHRVWIKEYDRIAESNRKAKVKPSEPAKVDPEVTRKILQSKEVAKAQAVTEKPGVGSPDADPGIEIRKRLAAVRREAKEGKPGAIQRLAYHAMYGELPNF